MSRLIAIVGLVFLFACKEQKISNKIQGVWILDQRINNLHLNNAPKSLGQQPPVIYDFKESGELIFKNYGYQDTVFTWSLTSDNILTIGDLTYTIHSLNQDSISLIDYNAVDTFWLTLKRPKDVKIDYNKPEIENILRANVWSIEDTIPHEWATHFEYFDNGTMIYRYPIFDRNFKDTIDNLQLETCGVAEYQGYYFLYSYRDMVFGNGNMSKINQLIDISPTSYITLGSANEPKKMTYHAKKDISSSQETSDRLKGNWTSNNTKAKTYGAPSDQALKNGRIALFEGDLRLSIQEKALAFTIDTLAPLASHWQLSKDGKTLVLEYDIDEAARKGIHVEYADVLELTATKMKVRLFDNNYYTGIEKPNSYLLNLIQEFDKIE